jgi:multiple sugar transport system substrate-binding protein
MKFKAGKFLLAGIACLAMTAATYADAATLRVTVSAR